MSLHNPTEQWSCLYNSTNIAVLQYKLKDVPEQGTVFWLPGYKIMFLINKNQLEVANPS